MARKIKISEQQYNLLKEDDSWNKVNIAVDRQQIKNAGGVGPAVDAAKRTADDNGVKNYTITVDKDATKNESKIITKKELMENRMKVLKKNSKLYTVKDFLGVK